MLRGLLIKLCLKKNTDEHISSSTDQAVGAKYAATSQKSHMQTSVATERALGSKTTATSRKSPLVQSSKKKSQQPSQHPLRRSPVIFFRYVIKL